MGLQVGRSLRAEPTGEPEKIAPVRLGRCEVEPDPLADAVRHGATLPLGLGTQAGILRLRQLDLGAYHAYRVQAA